MKRVFFEIIRISKIIIRFIYNIMVPTIPIIGTYIMLEHRRLGIIGIII